MVWSPITGKALCDIDDCSVVNLRVAYSCAEIFLWGGDRVLLSKGRKLASQYFAVYREPIPTKILVQQLAGVMQEATQQG